MADKHKNFTESLQNITFLMTFRYWFMKNYFNHSVSDEVIDEDQITFDENDLDDDFKLQKKLFDELDESKEIIEINNALNDLFNEIKQIDRKSKFTSFPHHVSDN